MRTICIILFTVICNVILAQKQEVIELNAVFEGKYEFAQVKSGLEINFLKNGQTIRKEYFKSSEINWEGVYHNEVDNVLVIPCKDVYPNCIDRKIIKTKSRNQYSKTILKTSGSQQVITATEILKRFSTD